MMLYNIYTMNIFQDPEYFSSPYITKDYLQASIAGRQLTLVITVYKLATRSSYYTTVNSIIFVYQMILQQHAVNRWLCGIYIEQYPTEL